MFVFQQECHPSNQYKWIVRIIVRARRGVLNNTGEKMRARQHAWVQTKVLANEIQNEVIAIVKYNNESQSDTK